MTKHRTYEPLVWLNGSVRFLDQTLLPHTTSYTETTRYEDIVAAVQSLAIRGAPLIGIAGAYAVVLASLQAGSDRDMFERSVNTIEQARPTAVNLSYAVNRLRSVIAGYESDPAGRTKRLLDEATKIHDESVSADAASSKRGADVIGERVSVLTICNTGPLATGGEGTAFGVIHELHKRNLLQQVYACETRPLLQGARLTMWEFEQAGIEAVLINDSAAGLLVSSGKVQVVLVGADRIAANGDTANKIGTYVLGELAAKHQVPFYVVAPESTIDAEIPDGSLIPIEERSGDEITDIGGISIAPSGTKTYAPAFDVTPAELITGIVTDKALYRKPYELGLVHRPTSGRGTS